MSIAHPVQYTEAVDFHPCLTLVLAHGDSKWVGELQTRHSKDPLLLYEFLQLFRTKHSGPVLPSRHLFRNNSSLFKIKLIFMSEVHYWHISIANTYLDTYTWRFFLCTFIYSARGRVIEDASMMMPPWLYDDNPKTHHLWLYDDASMTLLPLWHRRLYDATSVSMTRPLCRRL